jgi:hypothetical protein
MAATAAGSSSTSRQADEPSTHLIHPKEGMEEDTSRVDMVVVVVEGGYEYEERGVEKSGGHGMAHGALGAAAGLAGGALLMYEDLRFV